MSMRRQGRLHQTVAAQQPEVYWDYQPDQRVMTIDGPGRVIAVSDGPFPGSEEYEIRLEGGLGEGTYSPGQITAATSVEATEHHTADRDYPELGTILYDRPDPATIRHTAELGSGGGGGDSGSDGGSAPASSSAEVASGDAEESHTGWNPGEYNNALYHDWRVAAQDPGPNDIARSLDKFRDEQEERHQDDARYVPDFKPLQLSTLKPEEHSGWMFMERKDPQPMHGGGQTPPLFSYKHGITRTPLHLDEEGQSYGMVAGRFAGARAAHHDLNSKGHYRMLEQLGAKPGTAYDNDYIQGRNQRLTEHGWSVVSSLPDVTASTLPDDHPDKVYLRFGKWRDDERSDNNVTGGREEGVSVYDLDHQGDPMDPDPHMNRGHHHDESCEPDCDMDLDNRDYENDTREEMHGRIGRAQKGRRWEGDRDHEVGHLVKGKMVGIGHDGEPLIQNVKRVGDWIDHRHLFLPGAPKHPLARDEDDEGYEHPAGKPPQHKPFEAKSTVEDEDFDEDAMCGVQHDGTCEEAEHGSFGLDPRTAPVEMPGMHDTRGQQSLFATAHLTLGPSPEDRAGLKSHLLSHHGFTNDQISMLDDPGQGDDLVMEHHMEHNANADDGISGEFGRGEIEHAKVEHDHKGKGGIANRFPETTEFNFSGTPQGHYLSSLIAMAAMDGEFRFHVTAAWRDVQAKAKRIRKAGGVNITHASDGYVIANVQGDHHVYETGLQRVPGRRTAVAVYSCGCKWGAYHWGADDDMSRFAGRMCSHALALQYEAQARGMFGRDVTVDDTKPRWVPTKVVVKYDIDDGKNIQARSSLVVPEQAPLLAVLALADDDDPGLCMVLAAVNDMFGDQSGMTEPTAIDPAGPTVTWNKEESPASAGVLSGGEPNNWGRINSPTMYPRLSSAVHAEVFWQRLSSILAGVETTFHVEPEPALPSTDGDDHIASMGDVDLTGGSGIGSMGEDELSPEDPSMQTMGAQDIVAAFQRSAGAKHLMDSGKPGDSSSSDIAGAAEAYLQKTAASATEFSLAEREALINESPGVQAANTDRLDIAGTHYADLESMAMSEEDDYLWMT